MDLQLRKIHFVQEFLRLNNEQVVDKLEALLRKEKTKLYSNDLKPYSVEEFNAMIDRAEEDSKNNRLINARQLKKEITSWS